MNLFLYTGFSMPRKCPLLFSTGLLFYLQVSLTRSRIISVLPIVVSASPSFLFPCLYLIPFSFLLHTPVPPTHQPTRIPRSSDPSLLHPLSLPWLLLSPGRHRTVLSNPSLNGQSLCAFEWQACPLSNASHRPPAPSDWKRKHAHFRARSCPSAEIYRLGKITSPSLSVDLIPAQDLSNFALFSLPTPARRVLSSPSFTTSFSREKRFAKQKGHKTKATATRLPAWHCHQPPLHGDAIKVAAFSLFRKSSWGIHQF